MGVVISSIVGRRASCIHGLDGYRRAGAKGSSASTGRHSLRLRYGVRTGYGVQAAQRSMPSSVTARTYYSVVAVVAGGVAWALSLAAGKKAQLALATLGQFRFSGG